MNSKLDSSTPVLVLGSPHHGGLAITRSLGKLGASVYVVDTGRLRPAFFSRYCSGRFSWDLHAATTRESIEFLRIVASKIGRKPILIPTNDFAALFVADHCDSLSQAYLFPQQSSERSHSLVSKNSLFQLASRFGIPTPVTFSPASRQEARHFAKTAQYPVMMKADDCGAPGAAAMKYIANTSDDLLDRFEQIDESQRTNILFQEYIPGGDDSIWMFNGYFNSRSECLFGMTGQKLRQCPVYTGAACLAICRHNDTVHQTTLDFMRAVGYQGILDIGYRYDARDGKYKVLDVNPRIGSTFRLFVGQTGMDVARALYLDLTNQQVPSSERSDGRKWIVEDCDLVSSFRYWRDGNLKIADWIKSFSGIREASFLSITDPLPIVPVLASDLGELGFRLWRKAQMYGGRPQPEAEPARDLVYRPEASDALPPSRSERNA